MDTKISQEEGEKTKQRSTEDKTKNKNKSNNNNNDDEDNSHSPRSPPTPFSLGTFLMPTFVLLVISFIYPRSLSCVRSKRPPSCVGTYSRGESNPKFSAMSSFFTPSEKSWLSSGSVVGRVGFAAWSVATHRLACLDSSFRYFSSPSILAHLAPHSYQVLASS